MEKGLESPCTLPPLSTSGPRVAPRSHGVPSDVDQFRDLTLTAATPSLLVMPVWKPLLPENLEGQGPASFLSGPSCVPGAEPRERASKAYEGEVTPFPSMTPPSPSALPLMLVQGRAHVSQDYSTR